MYLNEAILDSLAAAERGELDGLVVSMPPQHGKSELCSKYLPAWFLGTYPDKRVILASYEADFASGWGRKARDLLEQHGHRFGVQVSKRSAAVNRWDLHNREGGMTTAGVGGPITGRGAHLLLVDDPVKNDEEARSPTIREKHWQWWLSVASSRLRPGALAIVIQTRWHRDDLAGRILQQAAQQGSRWRVVKLAALAEHDDPLGRELGAALWPDVYTKERLERVKLARGPYYWSAMYQQNPQAEGVAEWPDDFFGAGIWFNQYPYKKYWRAMALDPSKGTESKFGDYAALVFVTACGERGFYIDAKLMRCNTAELVQQTVEYSKQFNPDWLGVEVNQFQELLAGQLVDEAHRQNVLLPLYTIDNRINKVVRIRRLTPYLAQQQLKFDETSAGARLLVEQLRDFPCGQHDDGPDALEMALRLAGQQLAMEQPLVTERVWA